MNVFDFCGKISLGRETEKFHPIERKDYQSGWTNTTIKFNCLSGANRILCTIQGGKWSNDSKNIIKTFSKSTTDENGKVTKGSAIDIPWAKRFDADKIASVAGFRKFVVDTGDYKLRYRLQDAIRSGNIPEDIGVSTVTEAQAMLDKETAKKREYLSEWDFAEFVAKLLESGKYADKMFNVSGYYDIQYNAAKDTFYTSYHVNRITLAADDAEPKTEMKVDFLFGEDAFEEGEDKCFINGWLSYYDSAVKKNGYKSTTVVVREDNDKKIAALKRKFACDDGIKQIGLTLDVIDGAEVIELTMDMLDEETREDIKCGLLDFDDVKRELGGRAIGDRINELRFSCLTPKKNMAQDTVFGVSDMVPAKVEIKDEDIDIFSDEFDEI